VTVIRSTLSHNEGGGFWNSRGSATLRDSTLSRNTGDGLSNSEGSVMVDHGTVSNNKGNGLATHIYGSLTLSNTTVSNNRGAGIVQSAGPYGLYPTNVTLIHTTVAGNRGGGVDKTPRDVRTLTNSLIAKNLGLGDCKGEAKLQGVNLIGDSGCNVVARGGLAGDPQLGPLLDHGGGTETRALLAGSQAIDAAGDAQCTKTDQRRVTRPQQQHCDIGAFERVTVPAPRIRPIITFFDKQADAGTLVGTGSSNWIKSKRLEALRNELLAAGTFIEQGARGRAREQLRTTRSRIDIDAFPDNNDYVTGSSAAELADRIWSLCQDLGC